MTVLELPDIEVDAEGIARIAGQRMKVRDLAIAHTRHGYGPAELREHYPHLSVDQISAALAYYYAHRDAVEAEIAAGERFVEEMMAQAGPSPFVERLRREGRLP